VRAPALRKWFLAQLCDGSLEHLVEGGTAELDEIIEWLGGDCYCRRGVAVGREADSARKVEVFGPHSA
jgi:hypothetical protein